MVIMLFRHYRLFFIERPYTTHTQKLRECQCHIGKTLTFIMITTILVETLNWVFSIGMYLTIGRVILQVLVGNQKNAILEIFEIATNPIYNIVRKLTFGKINGLAFPFVVVLLLFICRVALSLFYRLVLN